MNLKYFLIVSLIAFCAKGRTIDDRKLFPNLAGLNLTGLNLTGLNFTIIPLGPLIIHYNRTKVNPILDAPKPIDEGKRFLGSIGNLITNGINNIVKPIENLVKPITGIVNPIVDALKPIIDINNVVIKPITDIAGNVITQIVDPLKQVVNAITNQVIDPIKNIVAIVTNPIAIITSGGSGNNQGPNSVDYCNTVCYSRVNFQDVVTDYYFDRANGCKSKGLMSNEIKKFDTCCDKHNQCLNSKCCTGDCQGLKDFCDDEYADCMDDKCQQIFNVNKNRQERSECLQVSEALRSASSAQKCTTQTVNRKICFC